MQSNGTVHVTEITPWEMKALRAVPVLADASGHEGAMRRLFPGPVAEADADPEDEAEWDEFVRPELEERFAANLEEFAAGLAAESGEGDQLRIAPDQVESWYLALNQARLVMSERFGIDTGDVDRTMELVAEGKLETLYHYELYTELCGWLVYALKRVTGM
jgi:hypothetical protein